MKLRRLLRRLLRPWLELELPKPLALLAIFAVLVLPGGIPGGAATLAFLTARRNAREAAALA